MRTDNLQFKAANEAPSKSPQFVVAILFDVGSLYITSHTGIASVPGIVLAGALQKPSAISQRVVPDEGRSEIGTFSFAVVDIGSDFTDEVRAKLGAGKGLRGKTVQLWCGYRGFDFSAFQLFQTQVISDCQYDQGVYNVTCEDITRQQRTNLFDPKATTLLASCSATDSTIQVADTSKFLAVTHGSAWSDAPSSTVFYFKLEKEIIRATAKTAGSFTGCVRGQFNTVAAAHTVDPATAQERRPRVEEFIYLDLPAPKLALAILTGGILQTWPANLLASQGSLQTDSNADGSADGWSKVVNGAGDGGRVYTASLVAGSSPFAGNAQRLINTTVGNSNDSAMYWTGPCSSGLTFTASAYIRTNVSAKVLLEISFLNAALVEVGFALSPTVLGDSIAHLAQVTAVSPASTEFVRILVRGITANGEFFEFDNVMAELGSTVHPYTANAIQGLLPEHWHVGMQPERVRITDFLEIGLDLWNPADDTAGFTVRFEGLAAQDGKRMLEREIYLLLGAYSPIYSDGTIGLRRLPAMVSDASPTAILTEREIKSISPLQHDYSSLHNVIRVTWGFDIGVDRYTRDTLFIDGQSVSIHGKAPLIEYQFRGLHSGIHTENMIRVRLDTVRDAYSYPPQRTSVVCLSSLNRFEMGDVFRLQVKNVRDFAGNTANIDRSFVILRRVIDFTTGDISFELFGSTLRPDAQPPSTEAPSPLPDAYYTAQGVALSTLVGMTGNSVNAGTHTIAGNASMLAAGAVVFHNADLVIPSGATINISANVQLRVRGFITMNGVINGNGGGRAGVVDPGGALTSPIIGNPGFIGNSRGWDGIDAPVAAPKFETFNTIAAGFTRAKYEAWPPINLESVGNTLIGIPDDLRGTGGGPGGRGINHSSGFTAVGGPGVAGGAGLAIVCRGISFGVSASITLNGTDAATTTIVGTAGLVDFYPGAGGAGGPGACLMLMDGNTILFPNAAGRFTARSGTVPVQGLPLPSRSYDVVPRFADGPYFFGRKASGYQDESIISNVDFSIAALKIQYVPSTQVATPDQNTLPSPLTDLTIAPGAGFNTVRATLPPANTFDLVEYYAAISNNRAGAVLIAKGRISEFQHDLPVLATRFYWARTSRTNETGQVFFSDWFPVGATSGVSATTLNPGGWTPITTAAGGATMIATASTIEKSGGSTAWDSQAYSSEKYPSCAVSFRALNGTQTFMVGLSVDPTIDASYTSIDFAWYPDSSGLVFIYESGVSLGNFGSYDASTQLAVTYDGESIRYFKNGQQIRIRNAPGLSLALDSSFHTPGAKALDVKFNSQPKVTDANRFLSTSTNAYAGTSIVKLSASAAWNSQTYSIDGYSEGAFATARADNTTSNIMFGLNEDPATDADYLGIDYAWYFNGSGTLQIYEIGVSVGSFGSYSTTTVLAVRHTGRLVQYIKDGVIVRSKVRVSTAPLYFDSSFFTNFGKLLDVQFGPAGLGAEADPNAIYLETFETPWETSFENISSSGSVVVTYPNNGQFGGKVLSAQRMFYVYSNENIPYDSNALYRISTRLRRTVSGGGTNEAVTCGVICVSADGVTLLGDKSNCADAFDLSAIGIGTWRDFTGYFTGFGAGTGVAPNVDGPTPLLAGTTFFRPFLILNYNNGTGTQECDFIKIERLINADDADNTDKKRLIPDAEFARSTQNGVFWIWNAALSGSISILPTGGVFGGLIRIVQATGLGFFSFFALQRRATLPVVITGNYYRVSIRVRRTTAVTNTSIYVEAGSTSSPMVPVSAISLNNVVAVFEDGTNQLTSSNPSSWTVNQWQEFSGIFRIQNVAKNLTQRPYLYLIVVIGDDTTTGTFEVDMVDLAQVSGFTVTSLPSAAITTTYTDADTSTSYTVSSADEETIRRFTSSSAITITLPNSAAFAVGHSFGVIRGGSGTLTFSAAAGATIRTPRGAAITVSNGKAVVTMAASGVWELSGDI